MEECRLIRWQWMVPTLLLIGVLGPASARSQTPVEQMSNTVESLCPALKGANTADPNALTAAQKDVLFRCGELKLGPGQSFGDLTASQLDGLGNMTSDESSAMGNATVDFSSLRNLAITSRLSLLRQKSTANVALSPQPQRQIGAGFATMEPGGQSAPPLSQPLITDTMTATLNEISQGYEGRFSQMSDLGRWGIFLNGAYGTGEKDATSREPGFDFDSWSLVSGVDYRAGDNLVFGFAANYAMTESSFDDGDGEVDLDGFGAALYGTYYRGGFYLDLIGGFGGRDYETERKLSYSVAATAGGTTVVNQTFDGETDATDFNLSLGTGYNLEVGGFAINPFAQLTYLKSDIDGYTESLQGNNTDPGFGLALTIDDQEIESLASTVGLQVLKRFNTSTGVFIPYLRADWQHEFEDDEREITAHFAAVDSSYASLNTIIIPTDEPDRDYFDVGAGLSTVLPGGLQLFFDYSTILGYDDLELHQFVGGVRIEI